MMRLSRPQRATHLVAVALCLLTVGQACGGRSDTEDYLFGADDGSAANGNGADGTGASNGSGANGSGANGSGANGSGANGSGESGSGANGSGGVGASGGTGPIGEGGFDGGGSATGGAAQGGSAQGGAAQGGGAGVAGAPAGPRVSCGAESCDTSKELCCAGLGGFGCLPKGSACNGAVLSCSQAEECPGRTVCCLRVVDDVGGSSQCKASCVNMPGPMRERQLCSSDDECPFGHCRPTVFGVSVCTRR